MRKQIWAQFHLEKAVQLCRKSDFFFYLVLNLPRLGNICRRKGDLEQAEKRRKSIDTKATVNLGRDDIGPNITNIKLETTVSCEGLSQEKFNELALAAKEKCPISRLYAGGTAKIELDAKLVG